ncbi:MarR family winged helix-turn-helix transcriptional regulator [Mycolicibacterium smegmatis]|jgi:DNA-binding MarR family transcriptional regulator|uniref:Helix-turn-helix, Fis-type n=1 Tax=Mycolicibacterium smegmatis (strain MKD8) TaxID=1214915 RepID=A0A2U9Q0K9_MYCSE|nr:MarR family transcriptional regulator [Mycolicibacterium smegmatis]AWT57586.1 helix-turn-helix, Fis-type [Mycolicibacterium smegmatis MKD8]
MTGRETRPGAAGVEELAEAADRLFLSMRRARGNPTATGGLSLAQLSLLDPLLATESLPVSELASAAGVSAPNATRMIQQLETKGFVLRERSAADERKVLVRLTDTGAQLLTRLRANRRATQSKALAAFTEEERIHLARQLQRLADIIDAGVGPTGN